MEKNEYQELADWLSTTFRGTSAINTTEFHDLLRHTYTPEEARLVIQMGPEGGTLDELVSKTGIKKKKLKIIIKSMQGKATIYTEPGSDNPVYKPLGMELPGLLEAIGFGDLNTPYKKHYLKLWQKVKPIYVNEGIAALGKHNMPWCSVKALPPEAKPEENLAEIIKLKYPRL